MAVPIHPANTGMNAQLHRLFGEQVPVALPASRITAVVLSYNEHVRIPYFLQHYKSIGVERFIVVDNGSTDTSAELLKRDPAVTYLHTLAPYKEYKSEWREALADAYLDSRWVLFPDVDELFVYPGWPHHGLPSICDYLESCGHDALFTTMVDMYPAEPLDRVRYVPGTSFFEASPYFDTDTYRLIPLRLTAKSRWNTPRCQVFGGPRERRLLVGKRRRQTIIDKGLMRMFFSLNRDPEPGARRAAVDRRVLAFLDGCFPELRTPNMSKVPLLRWQAGSRFSGGVHKVSKEYNLGPDWGALLHFKYFDDFAAKVDESVARGQHAADAGHYRQYQAQLDAVMQTSMLYRGSRRFSGAESLLSVGLMRRSPALAAWLDGRR